MYAHKAIWTIIAKRPRCDRYSLVINIEQRLKPTCKFRHISFQLKHTEVISVKKFFTDLSFTGIFLREKIIIKIHEIPTILYFQILNAFTVINFRRLSSNFIESNKFSRMYSFSKLILVLYTASDFLKHFWLEK